MIKSIAHIGITVSNINLSKEFYKNVLNLEHINDMVMQGDEADKLFGLKNCKVKLSYFKTPDNNAPLIELIEFENIPQQKAFKPFSGLSIPELCFQVDDIEKLSSDLKLKGVEFISNPQLFDFRLQRSDISKAVYFKYLDENVLEFIETI